MIFFILTLIINSNFAIDISEVSRIQVTKILAFNKVYVIVSGDGVANISCDHCSKVKINRNSFRLIHGFKYDLKIRYISGGELSYHINTLETRIPDFDGMNYLYFRSDKLICKCGSKNINDSCVPKYGTFVRCSTPVSNKLENFIYFCEKITLNGDFTKFMRLFLQYYHLYTKITLVIGLKRKISELTLIETHNSSKRTMYIKPIRCVLEESQSNDVCYELDRLLPFSKYQYTITGKGLSGYATIEFHTHEGTPDRSICHANCIQGGYKNFSNVMLKNYKLVCSDIIRDILCAKVTIYSGFNIIRGNYSIIPSNTEFVGTIIFLYYKKMCLYAIYGSRKNINQLDKKLKSLINNCEKRIYDRKITFSYEFSGLKDGSKYDVHIIPFTNLKFNGFISSQTHFTKIYYYRNELNYCFLDCRLDNKYYGLRSQSGDSENCIKWNNPDYLSNRCYKYENKIGCLIRKNTIKMCEIPKCDDIDLKYQFCVKPIPSSKTGHPQIMREAVKGHWEKPTDRTDIIGYMVLLHDYKGTCIKADVHGKYQIEDYHSTVRSLISSCLEKKHIPTITYNYHFKKLKSLGDHYVYIFATFSKNDISKIRRIIHYNPFQDLCYDDCRNKSRLYNGRQTSPDHDYVCHSKSKLKLWCMQLNLMTDPYCAVKSFNDRYLTCDIPNCQKSKNVLCPSAHGFSLNNYSAFIRWQDMKGNNLIGYFLMIFHKERYEKCFKAVFIYKTTVIYKRHHHAELLAGACEKETIVRNDNYYVLDEIDFNDKYNVYISGMKKDGRLGLLNYGLVISEIDCFVDCLEAAKYMGLRGSNDNRFNCQGYENDKEALYSASDCVIPHCKSIHQTTSNSYEHDEKMIYNSPDVIFTIVKICIKYEERQVTSASVKGKWSFSTYNHIGFIAIIHDDFNQCFEATIYGSLKPEQYHVTVRSFYISCRTIIYSPLITMEYSFSNLFQSTDYTIYIMATYSKTRLSQIKQLTMRTKHDPECLGECLLNKIYKGRIMVTKRNTPCIHKWNQNYVSNRCYSSVIKYKPICTIQFGITDYCDIPYCNHKINVYCVEATVVEGPNNSILVQWTEPRSKVKVSIRTYIITVHEISIEKKYHIKCIYGVTIGKNLLNLHIRLKGLYKPCSNVIHDNNTHRAYTFYNLKYGLRYEINIYGVLNENELSYNNEKLKIEIKECFSDCQVGNMYKGIRAGTKTGFKCQDWSLHNDRKYSHLKSNLCHPKGNKTVCYSVRNRIEECAVPLCEDTKQSLLDLEKLNSIKTHNMIFQNFKINSYKYLGIVSLLFDEHFNCIQAMVNGDIKPSDYSMYIRSFYISCKIKTTYDTNILSYFKFENLLVSTKYTVYIFGVLKQMSISCIRSFEYVTNKLNDCKKDCLTRTKVYTGIRAVSSLGKNCTSYDNVQYCKYNPKSKEKSAWCQISNGDEEACNIGFCEDMNDDFYCVQSFIKKTYRDGVIVTWTKPIPVIKNKISNYLVLLYNINRSPVCKKAVLVMNVTVRKHYMFQERQRFKNFYGHCEEVKKIKPTFKYEFKQLVSNGLYQVYIVAIIDEHSIPTVNHEHSFTVNDTFVDCYNQNGYGGLQSATIHGTACEPWKLHSNDSKYRDRASNICELENGEPVCSVGPGKLEKCPVHICQKKKRNPNILVTETISRSTLIKGKFKYKLPNLEGSIIIQLQDTNYKCIDSIIYSQNRRNLSNFVKSYFISCNNFKYDTMKNIYEFKNLENPKKYYVYIIEIETDDFAPIISKVYHTTIYEHIKFNLPLVKDLSVWKINSFIGQFVTYEEKKEVILKFEFNPLINVKRVHVPFGNLSNFTGYKFYIPKVRYGFYQFGFFNYTTKIIEIYSIFIFEDMKLKMKPNTFDINMSTRCTSTMPDIIVKYKIDCFMGKEYINHTSLSFRKKYPRLVENFYITDSHTVNFGTELPVRVYLCTCRSLIKINKLFIRRKLKLIFDFYPMYMNEILIKFAVRPYPYWLIIMFAWFMMLNTIFIFIFFRINSLIEHSNLIDQLEKTYGKKRKFNKKYFYRIYYVPIRDHVYKVNAKKLSKLYDALLENKEEKKSQDLKSPRINKSPKNTRPKRRQILVPTIRRRRNALQRLNTRNIEKINEPLKPFLWLTESTSTEDTTNASKSSRILSTVEKSESSDHEQKWTESFLNVYKFSESYLTLKSSQSYANARKISDSHLSMASSQSSWQTTKRGIKISHYRPIINTRRSSEVIRRISHVNKKPVQSILQYVDKEEHIQEKPLNTIESVKSDLSKITTASLTLKSTTRRSNLNDRLIQGPVNFVLLSENRRASNK